MIFTSYFAKTKKFPDNFVPVSISQWPPKGYKGLQCKALAPTKEILNTYKNSRESDAVKEDIYNKHFQKDVLLDGKINLRDILSSIQEGFDEDKLSFLEYKYKNVWESNGLHLVLVCYEKDGDFCHRNLVTKEMRRQGIHCRELLDVDLEMLGMYLPKDDFEEER